MEGPAPSGPSCIGLSNRADRLGVSRQTINAIETEKYDPSLPLPLKIGRLFGQAVEKIFTPDD